MKGFQKAVIKKFHFDHTKNPIFSQSKQHYNPVFLFHDILYLVYPTR